MAGEDALIFTQIEVDTETAKRQLRDFEKAAEQTAQKADASAKQIEASFKQSTKPMSASEREAFLKPFADVQAEIQGKIRGVATELEAAYGAGAPAAEGLAAGIGSIALAATGAVAGIGLLAFGLNEFADAADPVTSLRRGFETLTARIGENADVMLGKAKIATQGLVSNMELMRLTNEAIILQLPVSSAKMAELADVSTRLGRAMGVEPTKALESIILGIGRESNRLLDNIGILVDVKAAHEAYATQLGKNAEDLTEVEKRTAFFNATLEAGKARVQELGGESRTFSEYWKTATTTIGDTKNAALDFANVGLGGAITSTLQANSAVQTLIVTLGALSTGFVDAATEARLLAEAEGRLGSNFKTTEEEGLKLAAGYMTMYENLGKLGISVGEQYGKIQTMRGAVRELRDMLQATDDVTLQKLIKIQIQSLEDAIDKALGKAKEFKGFLRSIDSALPFPKTNPEDQPFGGKNPFGKPTGMPEAGRDPFGFDKPSEISGLSPMLNPGGVPLSAILTEALGPLQQMRDELLWIGQNASDAGLSFGEMAVNIQLSAVAFDMIQAGSQAFARVLVQSALTGKGSAKELRKALGDAIAGVATEQFARAAVMLAMGAAASTVWGAAVLGPPAPYFKAAGAHAIAGGISLAAAKVLGANGGAAPGGGGGAAGGAGTSEQPRVDYTNAVRTPGGVGDATGTRPVISEVQRIATPPPQQQTVIYQTYHVGFIDTGGFEAFISRPENRRAASEAISTERSGR